jgi:hypothetical protein
MRTLAGNGPTRVACSRLLAEDDDTGWTVSASDLLPAADVDPNTHALVIDTSPSRPTVSLFEVRAIPGYTCATWTRSC